MVEPPSRSPLAFILLVFALTLPFLAIGAVTGFELRPGLPVSALGAACPAVAALILVVRESGTAGVGELLKRSFDFRRIEAKIWYLPTLLLIPGLTLLAYVLMRVLGVPLPVPVVPVLLVLTLFLTFFVGALGEELGWSGYAIDPLQHRWNALTAAIVLGSVWAVWHLVPWSQAGRSPEWIFWQCVSTVALRVLLVWIYNNTGRSVFAAALCHASVNVSAFVFPNYGSHYDPRFVGPITVVAAVVVTLLWGSRTLTREGEEAGALSPVTVTNESSGAHQRTMERATRNPTSSIRKVGWLRRRTEARQLQRSSHHPPPRSTR